VSEPYIPPVRLPEFQRIPTQAESVARDILAEFDRFVDEIGDDYEAAITTEGPIVVRVREISFRGSFIVVIHGVAEDGTRAELIQHVARVSLFLVAVKRLNPAEPRPKIGFLDPS
jgi:hypothetical protein